MSQVEVDKIIPQSGTTLTIGDSGDTITVASGATLTGDLNADNLTSGTVPDARITGAYTGITNLTMSGDLTVDTNTLYVDSINNNVGIRTSSPLETLHIKTASSGVTTALGGVDGAIIESGAGRTGGLLFFTPNDRPGKIIWSDPDAHSRGALAYEHSGDFMSFTTNNSERMRIDSSGNLLVGKTSTTYSDDGLQLNPEGLIGASDTDSISAIFNRNGTDGNVVNFRKDGTTVGIIGVNASDNIYLSGNSTHAGIQFGTSSAIAFKNGSIVNNTLDLGASTHAWKDLYLGGGLYVGGTGTANKLDDYEEGDWTPTLIGGGGSAGSHAYNVQHGAYVKIGHLVVLTGYVSLSNKGSYSGTVLLGNFPFTVDNGNKYYSSISFYNANLSLPANNYGAGAYPTPNQTYAQMFSQNNSGSSNLDWSAINNNTQVGAFTMAYISS